MCRKFSILLVIPILLMLYNNTANRHQHILYNGSTVTHAHPFELCDHEDGQCPCHRHSEKEYLYYALISDSLLVVLFLAAGILISARGVFLRTSYVTPFTKVSGLYLLPLLRAPPVR